MRSILACIRAWWRRKWRPRWEPVQDSRVRPQHRDCGAAWIPSPGERVVLRREGPTDWWRSGMFGAHVLSVDEYFNEVSVVDYAGHIHWVQLQDVSPAMELEAEIHA